MFKDIYAFEKFSDFFGVINFITAFTKAYIGYIFIYLFVLLIRNNTNGNYNVSIHDYT